MDTLAHIKDSLVKTVSATTLQEAPKDNHCNYIIILIIICIIGMIGGIVNYLSIDNKESSDTPDPFYTDTQFYLQVLLGILGAALIPLFLNLTSSKLLDDCHNGFTYFIFSGYCIIGAIYSQSILNSVAKKLDLEKVQKTIKEQNKVIESVEKQVKEAGNFIENNLLNDDEKSEDKDEDRIQTTYTAVKLGIPESLNIVIPDLDSNMNKVLDAMQNSNYKDRSIPGLAKKTKLSHEIILNILTAFEKEDMVRKVTWYNRQFYRLTEKGRKTTLTNA